MGGFRIRGRPRGGWSDKEALDDPHAHNPREHARHGHAQRYEPKGAREKENQVKHEARTTHDVNRK